LHLLQGPALKKLCEQLAKELGSDTETITRRLEGLHECNPMMGLRGCRLGTVHPEITAMQVRVIGSLPGCWCQLA
jgi:pyruvate,orthophosphate dikinase